MKIKGLLFGLLLSFFSISSSSAQGVPQNPGEVFPQVMKNGGILADPKIPEEFYANARMYEQKGDAGNARRSYAKFFTFDLDYLDPHLRYQKYLKVQEGKEGAREVYFEMREDSKSFVTEFASILLLSRKNRVEKLKKFLEKHPEFGPGYYELSKDFSEGRLGEQTHRDKGNEKKYIKKFFELHEQGKVLKYFIDKAMVSKFLSNAEERMAALKNFDDSVLKNPVRLSPQFNKQMGWSIQIQTIDASKEYFYRLEEEVEFTSTGTMPYIDTRTGKDMANMMISLPVDFKKSKIYIKYMDFQGVVQGPYEIDFDPAEMITKSHLNMAKQMSGSIATMNPDNGTLNIQLMMIVCGLEKITYAFSDDKNLNRQVSFPKCDGVGEGMMGGPDLDELFPPGSPFVTQYGMTQVDVPADSFLALQFHYRDGTKSKIKTFEFGDASNAVAVKREEQEKYHIIDTPGDPCLVKLKGEGWQEQNNSSQEQDDFTSGTDDPLVAAIESTPLVQGLVGLFDQIESMLPKADMEEETNAGDSQQNSMVEGEESVQQIPDDANAHFFRANCYKNLNKNRQAIAAYKEVIRLDSNYPDAHYYLGLTHQNTGDINLAKIFYNKALKVNPNDTAARDQLSELANESVASNKPEENIISSDADDVADSYSEEVKRSMETLQSTGMCVGCPLAGVDMSSKDLSHNELTKADLSKAILKKTYLLSAKLDDANLKEADLTGANLTRADLTGANLTGANLTGANLTNANFTSAELNGANLSLSRGKATFEGANLTGANLSGANLRGSMINANLTGANLTGVNLKEADLSGANLTEANLTNANLPSLIMKQAGKTQVKRIE